MSETINIELPREKLAEMVHAHERRWDDFFLLFSKKKASINLSF